MEKLKYGPISCTRDGVVYSCDSLRIRYRLSGSHSQDFLDELAKYDLTDAKWEMAHFSCSPYPGKYQHQFTMKDPADDASFTILAGRYTPGCSVAQNEFVLDVNPNKCGSPSLDWVLHHLALHSVKTDNVEVVRWDLACDYPVDRAGCFMVKDKRKYAYECNSDADRTEYLGQRNTPGRCKLYNKTLESKLDYPLTRFELTCSGAWTSETIKANIPRVICLDPAMAEMNTPPDWGQLTATQRVLLRCVLLHPDMGSELWSLEKRNKKALVDTLSMCGPRPGAVGLVDLPDSVVDELLGKMLFYLEQV